MLILLSTGLRFRLAIALATFAAFCFVAPPALLAFGHGENTAHCLSMADSVNHGKAKAAGETHHADHSTPASDDSTPASDQQMTCCGLFCLSAVTTDGGTVVDNGPRAAHDPAGEPNTLTRISDRLDRPPIALLSV
jgi:hypothetical protein